MGYSYSKHQYYLNCEKTKAEREFNETLGRQEFEKLNILLLGKPGCGKSSFINTLNMVLRGKYVELARSGGEVEEAKQNPEARHGGSGVYKKRLSRKLLVYDMEKGMESRAPGGRAHQITMRCERNRLPNIVDVCGFRNSDNRGKELIRKIADGKIKIGTDIYELIRGEGGEYVPVTSTSDEPIRIDRIVFVVAANEFLPNELITTVLEECIRSDKEFQVFGVMTKIDIMEKDGRIQEMDQRIDAFISLLQASDHHYRVLPIQNYIHSCDKRNNDQTDAALLQFFAHILIPEYHCKRGALYLNVL